MFTNFHGDVLILAFGHLQNWYGGWALIGGAFLTGAVIGLRFHDEEFWGGYSSFRRRIVRLGHVALAALGLLNVVFAIAPWPPGGSRFGQLASIMLLLGAIAMPAVCFLTGWRAGFRRLFFIPVALLLLAVVLILLGGVG